jgi:predicted transglutaminase-like cysteine proteinase
MTSGGEPVTVRAPSAFLDACSRYDWLCAERPVGRPADPDTQLDIARSVNLRVNLATAEVSDAANYGVAEYWTLPQRGRGDCEDYVLAKYRLLLEAGMDSGSLAVAIVLDRLGRNHAVLVLHHRDGDLVLDNLLADVTPWHETGYRFLAMQGADDKRGWIAVAQQPDRGAIAGLSAHAPGDVPAAGLSRRGGGYGRPAMARGG